MISLGQICVSSPLAKRQRRDVDQEEKQLPVVVVVVVHLLPLLMQFGVHSIQLRLEFLGGAPSNINLVMSASQPACLSVKPTLTLKRWVTLLDPPVSRCPKLWGTPPKKKLALST